ncbi:MAG: thioredoxin domain-containing protein [Bacteroidetes bacterium HGW-Bacteroidetes-1]|jgi:hypothetical protein|nr:MAG: thioredoxin domain-containing protein [Bacteroidetes bacterium HGW-Bacteroidetes-1]
MQKSNQLIHETSPYLLQHAYNPVNWLPWNDDSLRVAKETNKILLVSIGYSACHWCHVMEHESFEDKDVAEIMNKHFVCIKVDREERPDVDHFFMEAIQLMGGRGGWPLNVCALPDGRPFWGGTYFRNEQWKSILIQIARMWENQPSGLLDQADQIEQGIQSLHLNDKIEVITDDHRNILAEMVSKSKRQFDTINGGSLGAPKFPMPDNLRFYLLMGSLNNNDDLDNHVKLSLSKMASGGIYDQLGGGFARYSVDDHWHVPHFEKMLYDNAQLISLYAEAYRIFRIEKHEGIVRESIRFISEKLLGPEGAFLSAIDADSEGFEGKYYVWTKDEFDAVLDKNAMLIGKWFGIGKQAQWEDNLQVLVAPFDLDQFCTQYHLNRKNFEEILSNAKLKLINARQQRVEPRLDDKRLVAWNSLQISALATAYDVFGEAEWLEMAQNTSRFILESMRTNDGGLYRSWKNGQAKIPAFLDDYSLFINALVGLYQSDSNEQHLIDANRLTQYVIQHFFNKKDGLFDFTAQGSSDLTVRPREIYDNVIPSSNAAFCMALVKLGILFENANYLNIASAMIEHQKPKMMKFPTGFSHWGQAYYLLENQRMVVIRGHQAKEAARALRGRLPMDVITAAAEKESRIQVVNNKPESDMPEYWICFRLGCQPAMHSQKEVFDAFQVKTAN